MGLFTFLSSCSPSDGRPAEMSKDDISRAALHIVYPLPTCSQSWIGGTVQQCDDALARVAKRRKEFENFDPPWMRAAIIDWFDYAEGDIKKTREDCITQKSKKDQEAFRESWRQERERTEQILKSIGR